MYNMYRWNCPTLKAETNTTTTIVLKAVLMPWCTEDKKVDTNVLCCTVLE